jgi:hypothetical protein
MQEWIETELQTVDLGDERLNERYKIVMNSLSQKPSLSINTACGGKSETAAAYRFFDNRRVEADEMMAPHQDATLDRIAKHQVVLLVQDTTEIDMTRPEEVMNGAGPLNDESRVGFFNHSMIAFTTDRVPLGVARAEVWARDWDEFRENQKDKIAKKKERRQKPIEDKESLRWLTSYRHGCEIAGQVPGTTIVVISDSEGDIYECLAEPVLSTEERNAEWIVRACQDRILANPTADDASRKLWSQVSAARVRGTLEVEVRKNTPKSTDPSKRNQARSARTATMTVQATRVTLKGPRRPDGRLPDLQVNAILVREIDPPAGEDPVEWLLLTSLPINTFRQVCKVIQNYCCRWQIEIYFKILKSGCQVEKLQLETAERFLPCLALYQIIAWRVMYLMMLGRECPEMSCDLVLSEGEWKSVYTVVKRELPRKTPPSLGEMIQLIASLGGYLGRKGDGPPGPKAMWIGMQRMTDLAMAWGAFGPGATVAPKKKKCV